MGRTSVFKSGPQAGNPHKAGVALCADRLPAEYAIGGRQRGAADR